jgi:LacI family transcriptional regulator
VDHLVRLGHRRVAMIGGIPDGRLTILRREAYRRILAEHDVEHDAALEDYGGWHVAGGAAAMARILDRRPETTAVYVQNDQMAIGALRTLHDRGVTVPRDFSLIGCDDLPFSAYTVPSLSTVRIPFAEIGEAAVRAVLAHIDDRDAEPRETVLPVDLVIRESTGPAPG